MHFGATITFGVVSEMVALMADPQLLQLSTEIILPETGKDYHPERIIHVV